MLLMYYNCMIFSCKYSLETNFEISNYANLNVLFKFTNLVISGNTKLNQKPDKGNDKNFSYYIPEILW